MKKINIFNYPELYNQVFAYRLYDEEVFFIETFIKKFFPDLSPDKIDILDLGAGTGEISKLLADKKYNVFALDLSFKMCQFIKKKHNLKTINADFANFYFNKKFHIILCLFNSLTYITDINTLIKHFQIVNDHLINNGLYIFELNHIKKFDNPYDYGVWATFDDNFNEYKINFYLTEPIDFENQTYFEKVFIKDEKNKITYKIENKKMYLFPLNIKLFLKIVYNFKIIDFFSADDFTTSLKKAKKPVNFFTILQKNG
ncbi:MAG TPA: class I SAM-dependent methyltransferase [bacterium]|nr:class I SAM-dependent methyltransferase [bacterium]HOL48363.1 class I SAM-dependent methyltransferase [bacterium]HPQ19470.1 class I SAM-dependent methyltransferase [bacterium]